MNQRIVTEQVLADAKEALETYGGTITIRRESGAISKAESLLKAGDRPPPLDLFEQTVQVSQVYLVYDKSGLTPAMEKLIVNSAKNVKVKGQTVTVILPMSETDYLSDDSVTLAIFASKSPIAKSPEGVEPVLDAIGKYSNGLAPDTVYGRPPIGYSQEAVKLILAAPSYGGKRVIYLDREANPEVSYELTFVDAEFPVSFWLRMDAPFSYFAERGREKERSSVLMLLARALAIAWPAAYGYCHAAAALEFAADPNNGDPSAPKEIYEVYWLNLYGAEMVDRLGREHVLATPAWHIEELPGGTVLLLTRPTPIDYASEEARIAQARALAHLRPDVSYEDALARLSERSAAGAPVTRDWDPDMTDLLELTLDSVLASERGRETERLNRYLPPEVTEWRPIDELLPSDLDDPEAAARRYSSLNAEQLAALLHDDVPDVMKASPESLPKIDYHFWRFDYPTRFDRKEIDDHLVPALGAYLGEVLVRNLGGHWVPRRNLDESQVVVGDRAWLPFLRARRHLQSKQSALDYSVTKLYREAERNAGAS